jgi:hypothetical protein
MKQKQVACLLVRMSYPSGSTEPRVDAELAERAGERGADGREYPKTPDTINGLECSHGSLGMHAWAMNGRLSSNRPEYERLHYVDAYALGGYVKTLALIEKRLLKMRGARGYATSWADHVLRFAEATGARFVAFPADVIERIDRQAGRRPRDLHGEKWAFFSTGDAADSLRHFEASFAPQVAAAE